MLKRCSSVILLALIVPLSLSPLAALANPGNGHGNSGNHGNGKGYLSKEAKTTTSHELISISLSYDRARTIAVNSGLTGYQSLPLGIAKNLARGKPLPPGIAKRAVPVSMLGQLPSYPGYEWHVVGDDLVLVTFCHC